MVNEGGQVLPFFHREKVKDRRSDLGKIPVQPFRDYRGRYTPSQ